MMRILASRTARCLIIAAAGLVCFGAAVRGAGPERVEGRGAPETVTLAEIVLRGEYPEGPQSADLFSPQRESLEGVVARIGKAARDPEISGLLVRLENPQIGWGKQHELRAALAAFRRTGKKAYAQLDLGLMSDYLVATACDEIVMPPSGMLMLTGLRAEVTFYKGLLDKLGIEADLMQMGDFKGSGEPFTRTELSAAGRAQLEAVLDDRWEGLLDEVGAARGLSREQVAAALDEGPFVPSRAKELGLVDTIAYDDELIEQLRRRLDPGALVVAEDYGARKVDTDFSGLAGMMKMMNLMLGVTPSAPATGGPKIAVVYAGGLIVPGEGLPGVPGGLVTGSQPIIDALRRASQDGSVSAIVLRVDSRGGSAMASDLIWREVVRCEKPIVASMGDTAASGGYYISMGADRIFAAPGTLTGSIGVIGGKIALRGLYEKLGVTTEVIGRGANSGAFSLSDRFTPGEREAVLRMMADTYEQFLAKAAQGRKMERARLEGLAGGRIWTGRMAAANGLVDKLGTLEDAIGEAKNLAGLEPDDEVELLRLPRPKSLFEQMLSSTPRPAAPLAEGSEGITQSALRLFVGESGRWELQAFYLLRDERLLTLLPWRVRWK